MEYFGAWPSRFRPVYGVPHPAWDQRYLVPRDVQPVPSWNRDRRSDVYYPQSSWGLSIPDPVPSSFVAREQRSESTCACGRPTSVTTAFSSDGPWTITASAVPFGSDDSEPDVEDLQEESCDSDRSAEKNRSCTADATKDEPRVFIGSYDVESRKKRLERYAFLILAQPCACLQHATSVSCGC
jgi:hypothetical protein